MAKDIWICENQKVTKWDGDILAYKNHLKAKVMKAANKDAKCKPNFVLHFWVNITMILLQRKAWTRASEAHGSIPKCSSIFKQKKTNHWTLGLAIAIVTTMFNV